MKGKFDTVDLGSGRDNTAGNIEGDQPSTRIDGISLTGITNIKVNTFPVAQAAGGVLIEGVVFKRIERYCTQKHPLFERLKMQCGPLRF